MVICNPDIDRFDVTRSTLALILFNAMKTYDTNQLIDWLSDIDLFVRDAAAVRLHLRKLDDDQFQKIAKLSDHARFEFRAISARVLGQLETPTFRFAEASFPILVRLLEDPYYEVRQQAATALGFIGGERELPKIAIEAMSRIVTDQDEQVRNALAIALISLVAFPNRKSVLESLAKDSNECVRDSATFVLQSDFDEPGEGRHPSE
jgi:HEAT repeat protein